MNATNEINKLSNEYDKFEESMFYIVGDEDRILRLEFCKKIQTLINKYPNSSKLHFMLGECLYNLFNWEENDKLLIELSFYRSDLLDNTVLISKIYLVYFYYDIGNYPLSLKVNSLINYKCLENKRRIVKLLELKLCCFIKLDQYEQTEIEKTMRNLTRLIKSFEKNDLCDVEPINLFEVYSDETNLHNKIIDQIDQLKTLFN